MFFSSQWQKENWVKGHSSCPTPNRMTEMLRNSVGRRSTHHTLTQTLENYFMCHCHDGIAPKHNDELELSWMHLTYRDRTRGSHRTQSRSSPSPTIFVYYHKMPADSRKDPHHAKAGPLCNHVQALDHNKGNPKKGRIKKYTKRCRLYWGFSASLPIVSETGREKAEEHWYLVVSISDTIKPVIQNRSRIPQP